MNDPKKEMLGTQPVGKLLFKLAIPTVVAQLINMLYNIIDRIYIGHMPIDGDKALTGVGVCLPIIMIVSAFACLVGTGGAPRTSIFMGKKDQVSAEKTIGNCFALQILISIILTTVLLIWNRPLLMAFGASENTINYAVDYMNIYAIGTIFVQLTLGMNVFITAQGFSKTSMFAVLIGALLNIALDPLFIFAFNMGVKGAALATIISQLASTIFVLVFLFSKKPLVRIKLKYIRLSPKIIFPCIFLGTATFIMQASESVIFVCYNASLQGYGGDIAVGAMTVFSSVMQFAMLPLQGIGQGAQPIISYNYGAKNVDRVKKTYWLLLAASMAYSSILYIVVMSAPSAFASMFTNSEELIAFTAKHMRYFFMVLFIFGAQTACQMAFVSIGYAPASIIVAVVRKFVLLLPLIYLMPLIMPNDKVLGIYLAEPIADVIAVTFTIILFSIQFSKALKKLKLPDKPITNSDEAVI